MARITMRKVQETKLSEVFTLYLPSAAARGVKDKTLRTYEQHFNAISKRLDVDGNISLITSKDLDKMILKMREEGLSDSSINSYTRTLKVFFSWCNEQGYSISLSPNLQQVRDMLTGLFAKLPQGATPIFHSDQGWQYQHAEYQRLLAEHNITQSMSRKGNCMDNGAMENFFGRLKVEMFYGEQFESVDDFILALDNYIHYYNNERISLKLKGMSPVQYRTHALAS